MTSTANKLLDHIDPNNDSILEIVLKGHLVIEGNIDDILRQHFPTQKYYDEARLSFSQKLYLVRACHWREHDNNIWQLLKLLNELRNSYAHRLDTEKQSHKLKAVLEYQLEIEVDQQEKASITKEDQRTQLLFALSYITGFLYAYFKDAEFLGSISRKQFASYDRVFKQAQPDVGVDGPKAGTGSA